MFDCAIPAAYTAMADRAPRGIAPPDDIRHRTLKWDAELKMWRERQLPALNEDFGGEPGERASFMGRNGATYRIGRGMRARQLTRRVYHELPQG